MKSTGEAIGYDDTPEPRAVQGAAGLAACSCQNYGTVLATMADKDKEEALPLIRRFYDLGFNIEATPGTAEFLKEHGIRTRVRRKKLSEGSGGNSRFACVRATSPTSSTPATWAPCGQAQDGYHDPPPVAVENNVTMFTALDTVRVLLDVLEEMTTAGISTIDA